MSLINLINTRRLSYLCKGQYLYSYASSHNAVSNWKSSSQLLAYCNTPCGLWRNDSWVLCWCNYGSWMCLWIRWHVRWLWVNSRHLFCDYMVLSFNKDNKNFGTMSEMVFADFPSVTLVLNVKKHDECCHNMSKYVRNKSELLCCLVQWSCHGRRENECKLKATTSELQTFTVHTVIAIYLEHAIFNLLQPAKCKYANCSENKSES